jgi:hypothetical protein
MHEESNFRWKDWLQAEQGMEFREGSVSFNRRIERVKGAITPSTVGWGAQEGVPPITYNSPSGLSERFSLEPINCIQQTQIASSSRIVRHLRVSPRIQALNYG